MGSKVHTLVCHCSQHHIIYHKRKHSHQVFFFKAFLLCLSFIFHHIASIVLRLEGWTSNWCMYRDCPRLLVLGLQVDMFFTRLCSVSKAVINRIPTTAFVLFHRWEVYCHMSPFTDYREIFVVGRRLFQLVYWFTEVSAGSIIPKNKTMSHMIRNEQKTNRTNTKMNFDLVLWKIVKKKKEKRYVMSYDIKWVSGKVVIQHKFLPSFCLSVWKVIVKFTAMQGGAG